jgi:hypothetical protein
LSLGNDFIKESCEAVPVSGSWGYACFGLNIPLAVEVGKPYGLAGGFDDSLDVGWEDQELCRMGIVVAKKRWAIHTGVMATSIRPRYGPGGISSLLPDLAARHRREAKCHERIHARWGSRYISDPATGRKYRCNWSRLLSDHGV